MRFVRALEVIFRLSARTRQLFDDLISSTRHVPTDFRLEGDDLTNSEFVWHLGRKPPIFNSRGSVK